MPRSTASGSSPSRTGNRPARGAGQGGRNPQSTKRPAKTDREETNDLEKCPDCGSGLSEWSDEYDRVVRHMRISWEIVSFTT